MFIKKRRIFALLLAMIVAVSITSCGKKDVPTSQPEDEDTARETVIKAEEGGSVTMPDGFLPPEKASTMTTVINPSGGMTGSFLLINYRTTDYFTITGDLTCTVNASLFSLQEENYAPQVTKYPQASIALWKRGENTASYVNTAVFNADGKTYTASFSGLDTTAQYRITFTYSEVLKYKMTGDFNVSGVASAGEAAEDIDETGKDAKETKKK